MKILDWFKNLLSRTKKDYMLNETNDANNTIQGKKEFVLKVNVDGIEHKKTREDILKGLREDIIVESLSEKYNYTKFNPENIKEKYDVDAILSNEDMSALSCLYGAIKDGNMWHSKSEMINGELKATNNKINNFLMESPDIITS